MEVVRNIAASFLLFLGGGASALRMSGKESLLKVCESEDLAAGSISMSSSH